jgi:tRNA (mo5U34)-methyltransferase
VTATRKRRKLSKAAEAVPFWWHSIDLGDGVVSDGQRSAELLAETWSALGLGDIKGKSVLDVGAWDGYFSFQAERHGAARVVALDHYAWSLDLLRQQRYVAECRANGTTPQPYHTVPELWRPKELPGKAGFDAAHRALESKVESVVGNFMTMDLDRLGTFDVVLYLGVLSHMRHPLLALERLARVTGELAVIETEAVALPGYDHHAFCEFFEKNELEDDPTKWWVPNRRALAALCRVAGFNRVESRNDPSAHPPTDDSLHRYRLVVRAWKSPQGAAAAGSAGAELPAEEAPERPEPNGAAPRRRRPRG